MPLVGRQISNIELNGLVNNQFKKINLADYRGKWLVLLFYPADFTFVCPTELSELADLYDEFTKEGAEVMSISTDTEFAHKAWHDQSPSINKIRFPMLADPSGKLCKELCVYLPTEGLSLRGSFVIDPDGMIKAMEVHDNSIGRSAQELLRKLQAAKFVREHGGEACPANWKPGGKTIRPGVESVGKL
ncbi:MAG: redoxin domain-containing protein [Patescibacteria group bacterium]